MFNCLLLPDVARIVLQFRESLLLLNEILKFSDMYA